MSVGTETLASKFYNPVASVDISVSWPVFGEDDVVVLYGLAGYTATLDTDYTVTLNPDDDYEDFIVTPTASLISKIDAMIAADGDEEDSIVIRRNMNMLTDMTPTLARLRDQVSLEFDRTAMRFQQLNEGLNRSLQVAETDVSGNSNVLPPLVAGRVPRVNAGADGWEFTDSDPDALVELATEQADIATAQAVTATAQAVIATTQADTATTQAGIATTQASNSAASASEAQSWALSVARDEVVQVNADFTLDVVNAQNGYLFPVDTRDEDADIAFTLDEIDDLGEPWTVNIKKRDDDTSTNSVVISPAGTDTIGGSTDPVSLTLPGSGLTLVADADVTPRNWTALPFGSASKLARTVYYFVADDTVGGQTEFTGADENGVTLQYEAGNIRVLVAGVEVDEGFGGFVASDGSTVTLEEGVPEGTQVWVDAYGTFDIADTYKKGEADGRYLKRDGTNGPMSGLFQLAGDATDDLHPVTKRQLDVATGTAYAQTNAVFSDASGVPLGDPFEVTDGVEVLSVSFDPSDAGATVEVEFDVALSATGAVNASLGVFVASATEAAFTRTTYINGNGWYNTLSGRFRFSAPSSSAFDVALRMVNSSGGGSDTVTLNSHGGANLHGGSTYSSLRVKEVA